MTREKYILRRAELLRNMQGEKGIALFLGNVDAPAQYRDNAYKFRQDSNWLYYFGLDEPGMAAVIDLESGEQTVFGDDVPLEDQIWTGPMESVSAQAEGIGIARTAPMSKLSWVIADALIKGRPIHFAPASRYATAMRLGQLLGIDPYDCFPKGKSGCPKASSALVKAIVSQRLIKSEDEIREIDAACDLGYRMHSIARDGIRAGVIEQEIVGEMEKIAQTEGWGVSFPTILTQHGEIFHCHTHQCPVEPGKLMVIDAGVESFTHYASDFTRTYPTSGRFTTKQAEIYRIVCGCHDLAFSMTRPGVSYLNVHKAVARLMLEGLAALDLVRGDVDSMAEDGIAGLFMPHGLGHNMGLDVHDMEDMGEDLVGYDEDQERSSQLGLGSLRMARKLRSGNVITDEPGIYFIPELIRNWKENGKDGGCVNYSKLEGYFDFGGIRLEDDILVTSDGARRLGKNRLPATVEEIEAVMNR